MPTGYISEPRTELGARLRELREECSLTQSELAVRLGTQANRVSDWEIGKHTPTLPILQKIAAFYGITVVEILEDVM